MAKQQVKTTIESMTEAELRRLVAKWVREALGPLVEGSEMELNQVVADENGVRYSKEARARHIKRVKQARLIRRLPCMRAGREKSRRR
jgi:hypothetical protein